MERDDGTRKIPFHLVQPPLTQKETETPSLMDPSLNKLNSSLLKREFSNPSSIPIKSKLNHQNSKIPSLLDLSNILQKFLR